jgi:hypothetical protein
MQVATITEETSLLHGRFGPRPRTAAGVPFRQLDQFPPVEMIRLLAEQSLALPGIRTRRSRMADAATVALSLPDAAAAGPRQAFIDGNEFCHLHPAPWGSLLLTLPAAEVEGLVALGWAERHPIHALGLMESVVLVYSPRTREEVEVVVRLVERSHRFAMGLAPVTAETLHAL